MKRISLIILALLFAAGLSGCGALSERLSLFDPLAKVKMSRDNTNAEAAAAAWIAANGTPDLDSDGTINGWQEWFAWVRMALQTYEANKK
jgi:hypothetical protein